MLVFIWYYIVSIDNFHFGKSFYNFIHFIFFHSVLIYYYYLLIRISSVFISIISHFHYSLTYICSLASFVHPFWITPFLQFIHLHFRYSFLDFFFHIYLFKIQFSFILTSTFYWFFSHTLCNILFFNFFFFSFNSGESLLLLLQDTKWISCVWKI